MEMDNDDDDDNDDNDDDSEDNFLYYNLNLLKYYYKLLKSIRS